MLFFRNRESKTGRNDPCPCGSGLKYKKCCMGKESLGSVHLKEKYYREYRIRLKEKADIEAIKAAGQIALATLDLVEERLKPGIYKKYTELHVNVLGICPKVIKK